jgi:uncharacterized protein (TIGR02231 family)
MIHPRAFVPVFFVLVLACGPAFAVTPYGGPPLPAQPSTVTLYPTGALITVTETLTPVITAGGKGLVLTLPGSADPHSFTLSAQGTGIAALNWVELPLAADSGGSQTRQKTLEALAALRAEQDALQGAIAAADARIRYWGNLSTGRFTEAAEIEKVDEAMQRVMAELHSARPGQLKKSAELADRIRLLERRLEGLGKERLLLRQVTALFDPAPSSPVNVTYSYLAQDCGWRPAYRFNALPAQKKILFSQDAELWQNTGLDWRDAALSVATLAPDNTLAPLPVRPWVVRVEKPEPRAERVRQQAPGPLAEAAMPLAAEHKTAARPAPAALELGTYTRWDIGPRALPSGETVRFALVSAQEWQGGFYRVIRPMRDKRAYLTAEPVLPEAVNLPQGQALYLVDGTLTNSAPFQYSGSKPELFFGADPLVSTELRQTRREGGDQGIISKSRSESWQWEIKTTNSHTFPVDAQVEDAIPRSTEQGIDIVVASTPRPVEEKDVYRWKATLKAGETLTIAHGVQIKAPAEARVIWGR